MSPNIDVVGARASEILEGVSNGHPPFECIKKVAQREEINTVLLVHSVASLGLPGGRAMGIVAAATGLQDCLSPADINRPVLEAIETTNLTGSTDHHSKVQERTP